MKSTVGYMELLNLYVERIVTAKDQGKFVVTHGTQQPLEIYEEIATRVTMLVRKVGIAG